jgi:hypothetical protein
VGRIAARKTFCVLPQRNLWRPPGRFEVDIRVKKLYYYLRTLDGNCTIFLREEICSPMLKSTQLETSFCTQEEAEEFVRIHNEAVVEKIVTA